MDLHEIKAKISVLNERAHEIEVNLDQLINKKQNKIDQLNTKLDLQTLRMTVIEKEKNLKNGCLLHELNKLKKLNELKDKELDLVKKELKIITENNKKASNTIIEDLNLKFETKKAEYEHLEHEYEHLEERLYKYKSHYQIKKQLFNDNQIKVQELANELQTCKYNINLLSQSNIKLQHDFDELSERYMSLEKENISLKTHLDYVYQKLDNLKKRYVAPQSNMTPLSAIPHPHHPTNPTSNNDGLSAYSIINKVDSVYKTSNLNSNINNNNKHLYHHQQPNTARSFSLGRSNKLATNRRNSVFQFFNDSNVYHSTPEPPLNNNNRVFSPIDKSNYLRIVS